MRDERARACSPLLFMATGHWGRCQCSRGRPGERCTPTQCGCKNTCGVLRTRAR
ncbi:hypothetical protein K438DRAFT_1866540, partial [Mycena galopus ATCC 62051]